MKNIISICAHFLLIISTFLFPINKLIAEAQQKKLYVQIKQTALRSEPKFWGSVLSELTYGAELIPVSTASTDKSWLKVKFGSVEGYAHVSSVTSRKITFSGTTKNVGTTADPVAMSLAGKGFNRKVESSYASSKGISFAEVDEIENQKVDAQELYNFIREGKLNEE